MQNETQRNTVCDQYEVYFNIKIKNDREIQELLKQMIQTLRDYGQLNLFCWCAPKRCHAETIRKYLLEVIEHGNTNQS